MYANINVHILKKCDTVSRAAIIAVQSVIVTRDSSVIREYCIGVIHVHVQCLFSSSTGGVAAATEAVNTTVQQKTEGDNGRYR